MDTVGAQLRIAARALADGSPSPKLDAEVLLAHLLAKPRVYLRSWPELRLSQALCQAFARLLEERRRGVPVAYLTGRREFWSREFRVGPAVLIPRPDTERLVELALARLPADAPCAVADLGTGSGAIGVTLALERPRARVRACDLSLEALAVARANAAALGAANIRFYHSDWFAGLPGRRFDLVVSNPPYVDGGDPHLRSGDVRFEPSCALVAADGGLAAIAAIAAQARRRLRAGGWLLVEHGHRQGPAVRAVFEGHGYGQVRTWRDLGGRPRVSGGCAPSAPPVAEAPGRGG